MRDDEPMRDHNGCPIAPLPHPDAFFDWEWRSNHGPAPMDGWRFFYACETWPDGCRDALGSMSATRDPNSYPKECPDCGGPVKRLCDADFEDRRHG